MSNISCTSSGRRWRRASPSPPHAIAGKSSGGYGALVHAMRHPELFQAVACHSGDMGFELALFGDLPQLMNAVRDHGSVEALVAAHGRAIKKKDGRWFGPLSMLALAAVYSPEADAPMGIGLPFDLAQGTLRAEVLQRWLDHDPVRMIERPEHQGALRDMKLVFVDCGRRDEHALHWGALAFHRRLEAAGGGPHLRGVRRRAPQHQLPPRRVPPAAL
jgi:S-formylglutathione hydrolase FrmB